MVHRDYLETQIASVMYILINRNIFFIMSKAWWNVKAISSRKLMVSMVLSGQQTLRPYSYIKRDTLFRGAINPKHGGSDGIPREKKCKTAEANGLMSRIAREVEINAENCKIRCAAFYLTTITERALSELVS